jgi:hypothetical protein
MEPSQADIAELVRQAVRAADYGLGRDGCPFCGWVPKHAPDCIAVVFGATGVDPEPAEWAETLASIKESNREK